MENKLFLEIRTPDKEIFKGEITQVILPGKDGLFGVLKDHAPMIANLQKGNVKVDALNVEHISDKTQDENGKNFLFEIEGGVVEVMDNQIIVLAG